MARWRTSRLKKACTRSRQLISNSVVVKSHLPFTLGDEPETAQVYVAIVDRSEADAAFLLLLEVIKIAQPVTKLGSRASLTA